jgi:hypothetical protein
LPSSMAIIASVMLNCSIEPRSWPGTCALDVAPLEASSQSASRQASSPSKRF